MKYTYTALEAAALWSNHNPLDMRNKMRHRDELLAAARKAMAIEKCRCCDKLMDPCPEYFEGALICPEGFSTPPSFDDRDYLCPPRPLPSESEAERYPGFSERLESLLAAIKLGDIPGSPECIRRKDLRMWMEEHYPSQRPAFLFSDSVELARQLAEVTSERDSLLVELEKLRSTAGVSDSVVGKRRTSYLNIIGSLLALLSIKCGYKGKDEILCSDLWDIFGGEQFAPSGIKSSNLNAVFAEAKRQVIAHDMDVGGKSFPHSISKTRPQLGRLDPQV